MWMVIVGTDVEARWSVDQGPLTISAVALAYPVFLIAIRRTWLRNRALSLVAMGLHFLLLLVGFGTFEALTLGHLGQYIAAFSTLGGALVASFAVPIFTARGQAAAIKPSHVVHVISWSTAVLGLLGMPLVLLGVALSGAEMVNANAVREFCLSQVNGQPEEWVRQMVPPRFIHPPERGDGFEISSHGRGCIVGVEQGTLTVRQVLPRYGFPWALRGEPRTTLR
jgi:hypothetical protein